MTLSAGFLMLVVRACPARAAKTDPLPETVWEQIMTAQSHRDLRAGADHMEAKDFEKAVLEFSKAVLARPQDPQARVMLGAAYYWTGRVDQAETEFREALRLDPKSAQAHLLLGIAHAWKGDGPRAYQEFLEAEKLAPERSDIQMNLGSMEESLGRSREAIAHFRKAVQLEPKAPLYRFQLGMLYRRLERYADAEESLRAALQQYPEFEDAMLELGSVLERLGRNGDAEDMFRRAVRLKSRDAVARLRLGRALLQAGKREKAREVFRDAFHLTPDEGGGLALNVSFGGRPRGGASGAPSADSAEGAAREENDSRADPLSVLSRNLERLPLDQDAELGVELVIMPRPKLVPSRPREGPSSLKKAMEAVAGKAEAGPTGIRRDFTLKAGGAPARKEQIGKVLEDLRGALAQAPPDAQVRMAMRLNISRPAAQAASRLDADGAPKVSYQPRRVGNDMGLWVMGTGWMALVEEVLPEPGEEPEHPDAADWWVADGLAWAALGDGRRALGAFDKALGGDPADELALLGRAVAYVEMGREQEAVKAYRRLLALNPKNRAAKDGLAWLLREPAR